MNISHQWETPLAQELFLARFFKSLNCQKPTLHSETSTSRNSVTIPLIAKTISRGCKEQEAHAEYSSLRTAKWGGEWDSRKKIFTQQHEDVFLLKHPRHYLCCAAFHQISRLAFLKCTGKSKSESANIQLKGNIIEFHSILFLYWRFLRQPGDPAPVPGRAHCPR